MSYPHSHTHKNAQATLACKLTSISSGKLDDHPPQNQSLRSFINHHVYPPNFVAQITSDHDVSLGPTVLPVGTHETRASIMDSVLYPTSYIERPRFETAVSG